MSLPRGTADTGWRPPGVGAIATQSYANPRYGPDGLALLREGRSALAVVEALTSSDPGSAERQVGVVDSEGRSATFTGEGCHEWAGGRTGDSYAAQGNILVSAETVDSYEAGAKSRLLGGALLHDLGKGLPGDHTEMTWLRELTMRGARVRSLPLNLQ